MAFTLHLPNRAAERVRGGYSGPMAAQAQAYRRAREELGEKLGTLSPALSLQSDVLFPNALASVTGLLSGSTEGTAVGCVGQELDRPFPLQPRLPVPLPLLLYPSNARGSCWAEQDMCALPVLSWEAHVKSFTASAQTSLRPRPGRRSVPGLSKLFETEAESEAKTEVVEKRKAGRPRVRPLPSTQTPLLREKPGRKRTGSPSESKPALLQPKPEYKPGRRTPKPVTTPGGSRSTESEYQTKREIRRVLLRNETDVEEREHRMEGLVLGGRRRPGRPRKQKEHRDKLRIELRKPRRDLVHPAIARTYLTEPRLKLKATWNYLYGGTGACDWAYAERDTRNLYVGNGTKLRMVSLKPSRADQLLSYSLVSVWEETQVPAFRQRQSEREEALNDLIFQVQTQKRRNLVAVRRGRSVSLYKCEDLPVLLCTVPNVGFGRSEYLGWKGDKTPISSPLLLSLDLNHISSSELLTMDENRVIQFLDMAAGEVVHQVRGHSGPSSAINAACGVAYAADHPEVIYEWVDSVVSLYDRRARPRTGLTTELFNLRTSASSRAWSDAHLLRSSAQTQTTLMNEYISALKPAANARNYYLGTTSRVLLMDVRVPGSPVVKFSHGMKSPAAYLDILTDDNFEVLVGGSQRTSEFFCACFDYSHVGCVERRECRGRNPLLQSYPRHLQSPAQFLDWAGERGYGLDYELEHGRVRDHFRAWSTGLCVLNPVRGRSYSPTLPHPFFLCNSNSFGDIFCQEWEQGRRVGRGDLEESLGSFVGGWRGAMESMVGTEDRSRPLLNGYKPVDLGLVLESSAHSLGLSRRVRTRPFDPFTPSQLPYNRVCDGLGSIQDQLLSLPQARSHRARAFLDLWTEEEETEAELYPSAGNTTHYELFNPDSAPEVKEEMEEEETGTQDQFMDEDYSVDYQD